MIKDLQIPILYFIITFGTLFLVGFCSDNTESGLITGKITIEESYYMRLYKQDDVALDSLTYVEFKERGNDVYVKPKRHFFVINGDYKNRIEVDSYTFNEYLEGQKYIDYD